MKVNLKLKNKKFKLFTYNNFFLKNLVQYLYLESGFLYSDNFDFKSFLNSFLKSKKVNSRISLKLFRSDIFFGSVSCLYLNDLPKNKNSSFFNEYFLSSLRKFIIFNKNLRINESEFSSTGFFSFKGVIFFTSNIFLFTPSSYFFKLLSFFTYMNFYNSNYWLVNCNFISFFLRRLVMLRFFSFFKFLRSFNLAFVYFLRKKV